MMLRKGYFLRLNHYNRCISIQKPSYMKKLLNLFALLVLIFSCSREKGGVVLSPEGMAQPKSAEIYCRMNNSLLSSVNYSYKNGRIVYEKTNNTEPLRSISEKFYEYNAQDQIINIRNVYTSLNQDGSVNYKSEYNMPREYKDDLLYKEYMDVTRQSYYLYTYKNGSLDTKTYYDKNGAQGTITYLYENGLLNREQSSSPGSTYTTQITYEYDAQKRLSKVYAKENNHEPKLITEYFYDGIKLLRKETYAWGIDPCFELCCGNWTYEYNY